VATKETVIAYWQANRPLVEGSNIRPENQKILSFAGQVGYLGAIATAFAARNQTFGGISSILPTEVADYMPVLECRGVKLHAVAAPQAELVARVHMRRDLAAGAKDVETALINQGRELEPRPYDLDHEILQNTGRLFIPTEDHTIPTDLLQMLEQAATLYWTSETP
jgi:hypothetical protein